jgi:hypothetical protein
LSDAKEVAKKSGPKTKAGKLVVSRNASKHGILSVRPVVAAFESEAAWKSHREGIIDSLAPEGGMEQALAERVALCTWRLNRVTAYETESIAESQAGVQEEVREDREHTLRFASIHTKEAKDIVAGSTLGELVTDPRELSDYAIELLSEPEVALRALESSREHYEAVLKLFDGSPEDTITTAEAGWILEKAPRLAAESAAIDVEDDNENEINEKEIGKQALALTDMLFERIEGKDVLTISELHSHLEWLAHEAGMQDSIGVDGTVAYTPLEALLEVMHTVVHGNLQTREEGAHKVERQMLKKRRERILPSAEDIGKIGRYEAHISRELYRALHELEALQKRRSGEGASAPLGRLDVTT